MFNGFLEVVATLLNPHRLRQAELPEHPAQDLQGRLQSFRLYYRDKIAHGTVSDLNTLITDGAPSNLEFSDEFYLDVEGALNEDPTKRKIASTSGSAWMCSATFGLLCRLNPE